MWISISQASLQRICNKEGFDIVGDKRVNLSARIGTIVNHHKDCEAIFNVRDILRIPQCESS